MEHETHDLSGFSDYWRFSVTESWFPSRDNIISHILTIKVNLKEKSNSDRKTDVFKTQRSQSSVSSDTVGLFQEGNLLLMK